MGRLKLESVNVGNSFRECGSEREWRNGELIRGRSWDQERVFMIVCPSVNAGGNNPMERRN